MNSQAQDDAERTVFPTVAQWARARALTEACELYMQGSVKATEVEALTLRWAKLIETGAKS